MSAEIKDADRQLAERIALFGSTFEAQDIADYREECETRATAKTLVALLETLPTEWVEGEWVLSGNDEPAAVVTYTAEPVPETGHVGWCWWALGKMGDGKDYFDARRKAEEVITAWLRKEGVR